MVLTLQAPRSLSISTSLSFPSSQRKTSFVHVSARQFATPPRPCRWYAGMLRIHLLDPSHRRSPLVYEDIRGITCHYCGVSVERIMQEIMLSVSKTVNRAIG